MKRWLISLLLTLVVAPALAFGALVVWRYQRSIQRAKEATYRQDLVIIQNAIDSYTLDKHQPPKSLQDLVNAHYLSAIPKALRFTPEKEFRFSPDIDVTPVLGDPVFSPNRSVFRLPHMNPIASKVGASKKTLSSKAAE